jgi:hypothetical protein
MINATHQGKGIVEKTFVRKFMKLLGRTKSDVERIPRDLHAAKITKGLSQEYPFSVKVDTCDNYFKGKIGQRQSGRLLTNLPKIRFLQSLHAVAARAMVCAFPPI